MTIQGIIWWDNPIEQILPSKAQPGQEWHSDVPGIKSSSDGASKLSVVDKNKTQRFLLPKESDLTFDTNPNSNEVCK